MPSNNTSSICHYFAGKYPGKIGILNTPNSYKKPPFYMPYALDNGCFTKWEKEKFFFMLRKVSLLREQPIFVCVPDVVADAEETNRKWFKYNNKINFNKAFVAQDGHEPQDIPKKAYAVFVGGSTDWKLNNAHKFKGVSQWLHIGRVNTGIRLRWAERIGADSVDGTGFFKGRGKQYFDFIEFFEGGRQIEWV